MINIIGNINQNGQVPGGVGYGVPFSTAYWQLISQNWENINTTWN